MVMIVLWCIVQENTVLAQNKIPQKYLGSYTPISRVYLSYGDMFLRADTIEMPSLKFKTKYTVIAISDSLPQVPGHFDPIESTRYLIRFEKVFPPDKVGNHMFIRVIVISVAETGSLHVWGTDLDKVDETKLLRDYSVWGIFGKQ